MTETTENTKILATLSLVLGILSIFLMPILFGSAAITIGTIAGSKGSSKGWWGMGLGTFGLAAWIMLLVIDEILNL